MTMFYPSSPRRSSHRNRDSQSPSINPPPPPYTSLSNGPQGLGLVFPTTDAPIGTQYGSFNNPAPSTHGILPPTFIPPPSSQPHPRVPHYHDSDETTALMNTDNKGGKKTNGWIINHAFPLFILMTICLCTIAPMVSMAVRHEIAEWQRVRNEILIDIRRLGNERRVASDDLQQLQIERDEKRREWELEREENEKRRRGHVPFWGEARLLNGQCPRDRFRRYEARMYNLLVEDDWYAACMKEPLKIAGREFAAPSTCVNRGLDNGVRGFWSLEVNTRECPRTIWDRLRNIFT